MWSYPKKPTATTTPMTQVQVQVQPLQDEIKAPTSMFADLTLGDKYRGMMKNIVKEISNLKTDNYGIKEDTNLIVPNTLKENLVAIAYGKTEKEKNEIHDTLTSLMINVKKLKRQISEHQLSNYKYMRYSKRHREYSIGVKQYKQQRKQAKEKIDIARNNMTINSSVSLEDLVSEEYNFSVFSDDENLM
jgi:hypothetical protein